MRATATTVDRFLKRADSPHGSKAVFLFAHPKAKPPWGESPLAALDWLPPKIPVNEDEPADSPYERLSGTAHIGIGGDRAIRIARFKNPKRGAKTLTESLYARTPAETYLDFHKIGALKFGHWVYGNTHDLLTINLERATNLSALDNGPLLHWLVSTLKEFKVIATDNSNLPEAILIYPSHPVTDQIIALLDSYPTQRTPTKAKDTEESNDSDNRPVVIPLKFMAASTVSPFRVSPLTYDRLRTAMDKAKRPHKPLRVVIFDDAMRSGKTLTELEQLARELGATEIRTVTILNRTALPIHLAYSETFTQSHKTFWKWDVPSLGHHRGCPLCAAIARMSAIRDRTLSGTVKRRIERWEEAWRAVDVIDDWEKRGLTSTRLRVEEDVSSHRFGIFVNEEEASHSIEHRTSTSLTAAIMEICRLTTGVDYALYKARRVTTVYGPAAGIEIVAAQLLLFLDELNHWQKVDRFRELLTLLWESDEECERTALAGLCLALADDSLILDLWPWLKRELIPKRRAKTVDCRIAADLLRHRYRALKPDDDDQLRTDATPEERFNYAVMFLDGTLRQSIARVFEILGASFSMIHNLGLHAQVRDLQDAIRKDDLPAQRQKVVQVTQEITYLLEGLTALSGHAWQEWTTDGPSLTEDMQHLKGLIRRAEDLSSAFQEKPTLSTWAVEVATLIAPRRDSLAERYRHRFFITPRIDAAHSTFLAEVSTRLNSSWAEIIKERIRGRRPVAPRWQSLVTVDDGANRPLIECATEDVWSVGSGPIYFDRRVEHCVYEVLANFVHATKDINNPWLRPKRDHNVKATIWWRIDMFQDCIEIEFANACDRDEITLSLTEARSRLERVGGDVWSFVVGTDGERQRVTGDRGMVTKARLDRLVGASVGDRIGVTVVRIPTALAVRGD